MTFDKVKFWKEELPTALESGEYQQARGELKGPVPTGGYGHCCLGVASVLIKDKYPEVIPAGWVLDVSRDKITWYHETGVEVEALELPPIVRAALGLSGGDHRELTSRNDGIGSYLNEPHTFEQIARYMREELKIK